MCENAEEPLYLRCRLCPRCCGVNRYRSAGFCGAGTRPKLAKAMLHRWEEPVLSASGGSGAVFFSNCTLRCVYCQNHEISAGGFGREVSERQLADLFLGLEQQGAQNIDLITAGHYLPSVIAALNLVRHRLRIPVVYNCGGYEPVSALRLLDGYVDIYLPDVKYFDDALAVRYSSAPHYFETACGAVGEMLRQTGRPVFAQEAKAENADVRIMKKGVLIRHMVLPSHRDDSAAVVRELAKRFDPASFQISLLRQYTPSYLARTDPSLRNLNRRVTGFEYESVVAEAVRLGLTGFRQEKSPAGEKFTPDFDLAGIPIGEAKETG